ncbi:unnamed protein product [Symbiodinium microadriaticum]|nr:unnamed protein product [Symbiodinium microadriaticum]
MEASVQRETEVNAALEEQCAAACTEWGRSKEAVSAARRYPGARREGLGPIKNKRLPGVQLCFSSLVGGFL